MNFLENFGEFFLKMCIFICSTLTEMHLAAERSHTICILSVPSTMTCLIRFLAIKTFNILG